MSKSPAVNVKVESDSARFHKKVAMGLMDSPFWGMPVMPLREVIPNLIERELLAVSFELRTTTY